MTITNTEIPFFSGGALLGGVIANSINAPHARRIVDDFVERTSTRVMAYVPRSVTVTQAELAGKTTLEAAPKSAQADVYRNLAKEILNLEEGSVPVASSDGKTIDQHLGQATTVWVYDVDRAGNSEFIETRTLDHSAKLEAHHWESVERLFGGVDVALAVQAGPGATDLLRTHEILALAVSGPVERAVSAFGRRGWMLSREPARLGSNGRSSCQGNTKGYS